MTVKTVGKTSDRAFVILVLLLGLAVVGCSGPEASDVAYDEINTSGDPQQVATDSQEDFVIETKKGSFTIRPVAKYVVSAMVVGKKRYSSGWQAKVAPLDLALAWGRLAVPDYDEFISYRQSDRWYFYRYNGKSPVTNRYIVRHSSNNHIIPASPNIKGAVSSVDEKDKVTLEGYLVNVTGNYGGREVWWNSSTSRGDTGDGSCELFYVVRARVGNSIYE